MLEVVPGDPASFMLGINAEADTLAAMRRELGLDQPMLQRYLSWLGGMLTGDFGISYTYRVPVSELVMARIWISLPLAIFALILSTLIAVPAGLIAASRRGRVSDWTVMGTTQLGIAIPNFWFAMILVSIFAIKLRWFSAGGFPGWDQGFWICMQALLLPAIALALPQASILARVMRSSLLETLSQDYIRTARAKGLTEREIVYKHALKNSLGPVVTLAGLQFSAVVSGAVLVETVFSWPGLGTLALQSILARDTPTILGILFFSALVVIVGNLLTDFALRLIDPRIRSGGG